MIDLRVDLSGFEQAAAQLRAAGKRSPDAARRAINHTGDKALTAMGRVLVDQTGLSRKTTKKALKATRASQKGGGSYTIKSKGGNIRLKFFKARETKAGVSAAPWNKRALYAKTFMKGGRFPNRVPLKLNGAVVIRAGRARYPLKTIKSGLFIAEEMVTGQSAQTFYSVVARDLPNRIAHEIARIL